MEDSPWLCRDQRRGALGSCVHPHRPWSKSHPPSDGGEVATAGEIRSHFRHRSVAQLLCIITSPGAFHLGYYRLLMAPLIPRFIFFFFFFYYPAFMSHLSS